MYFEVKYFYLKIFYIFCSIISIQCICKLNFPSDEASRPNFYKTIGSHKVKINLNEVNEDSINISNGEQLEAYCDTVFESPERYQKSRKLDLKCDFGYYIYFKSEHEQSFKYYVSTQTSLECSTRKWNLYESTINYDWCSNVTSYMLARHENLNLDMQYSAAICYDIHNREFQSVYYTLAPKDHTNMYPPILEIYSVGLQIDDFVRPFNHKSLMATDFKNEQIQNWMNIINYEFRKIVHYSETDNFKYLNHLFQFASLPTLYRNNWKRYETALEQHIKNDKKVYDILAGVSGAIKAPISDDCTKSYSMMNVLDKAEHKIPLYVWNYLMDRNNRSNELVIIGFNSPFNEFYSKDDIQFCTDKCRDIPWLGTVHNTFQYQIMGIVFCCDVEEVRKSKRLEGFPEIDLRPMPQTTLEPIEVTTKSLYDILTTNVNDEEGEGINDKNNN